MITGFVSLIGTILGIVFWEWKRKAAQDDDPAVQLNRLHQSNEKIIANRDVNAVNIAIADKLERLRDEGR